MLSALIAPAKRAQNYFRQGERLPAFFTVAPIRVSSAAVNSFSAKAVGHMAPSSRFASSVKPNVKQKKSTQID
jgi:hypothetical protein